MFDIGVGEYMLLLAMIAVPAGLAVAAAGLFRRHLRGSVEPRLDALNRLLRAGRITPAEYSAARASALGIVASDTA